MNKTLVALLATTLLSTSTVTLAIADAHGPQKTIGQTKALIAEAGLSSVSNASSLSKNLKDGESGNTNFPFANFKAIATVGEVDAISGLALTGYPDGQAA
jgi:hypothetical protein